jgi:hypothetical protein
MVSHVTVRPCATFWVTTDSIRARQVDARKGRSGEPAGSPFQASASRLNVSIEPALEPGYKKSDVLKWLEKQQNDW